MHKIDFTVDSILAASDLMHPVHAPVTNEVNLVRAQDQLHILRPTYVFQYSHQLPPIVFIWCLHSSSEEQHCHLDIVSCSVCCKEELVHRVVESIRQLIVQLPPVLAHLNKVIICWHRTHSYNFFGEFLYDFPKVVPHVDPYFLW